MEEVGTLGCLYPPIGSSVLLLEWAVRRGIDLLLIVIGLRGGRSRRLVLVRYVLPKEDSTHVNGFVNLNDERSMEERTISVSLEMRQVMSISTILGIMFGVNTILQMRASPGFRNPVAGVIFIAIAK